VIGWWSCVWGGIRQRLENNNARSTNGSTPVESGQDGWGVG